MVALVLLIGIGFVVGNSIQILAQDILYKNIIHFGDMQIQTLMKACFPCYDVISWGQIFYDFSLVVNLN